MMNANQTPSSPLKNLESLPRHTCVVIEALETETGDMERLQAMGICRGRTVEILQVGDPLILRVYGSRLGVSARLAKHIFGRPCAQVLCPPEEEPVAASA